MKILPTAVGRLFKSYLEAGAATTSTRARMMLSGTFYLPVARAKGLCGRLRFRLELKYPSTAVEGIRKIGDLNV